MNDDEYFDELNTIELRIRKFGDGDDQSTYFFYDYIIDGDSLFDELGANYAWQIGVLSADDNSRFGEEYQQSELKKFNQTLDRFLGKSKPDFQDEYYTLFACHCCHSLECGGCATKIQFLENTVIWQNTGDIYKTDDGKFKMSSINYTFEFDRTEYEKAFNALYKTH